MDKVVSTLRVFGILAALWLTLTVTALVTGALELDRLGLAGAFGIPDGGSESAETALTTDDPAGDESAGENANDQAIPDDEGSTEAQQAVTDPDALAPESPENADSENAASASPETASTEGRSEEEDTLSGPVRWEVCNQSSGPPSLTVAQLYGDGRPELIIGCDDGWHVVGLGPMGPVRIATFAVPTPPTDQHSVAGPAAVGDLDGDNIADLLLPLAYEGAGGATRGGALTWVPGNVYGGIREPVVLAPIAAVHVTFGAGDESFPLVAMNRANPLAQLPSEAWVFGGGAAPTRRSALVIGRGGLSTATLDLDRDGNADVVSLSPGKVELRFGDAEGRTFREHSLSLPGAREMALGDLDGDGAQDLAVLGQGLSWIRAGAVDGMQPRGLDGIPAGLRGLSLQDVNGDRKLDLVGWNHPTLWVLEHRGELDFHPEPGVELRGQSFGPRRHALADLDQDGQRDDLVLLGVGGTNGEALEFILILDALTARPISPQALSQALPTAPLWITATLPAANRSRRARSRTREPAAPQDAASASLQAENTSAATPGPSPAASPAASPGGATESPAAPPASDTPTQ